MKRSWILWLGLIGAVVAAAAVFAYVYLVAPGGTPRQSVEAPTIGGPFSLVDQDGHRVTDADFRGHFMLVYFGYTYCPDVCPTTLTTIAGALDLLGPDGDRIVPILITVDPERDTPEHLKMYVGYFHPRLVGLTGTVDEVAAAVKAYRVYFAKVREEGADADDYLMDHTAIVYLMGPDGRFLAHFGHDTPPEAMAERIREFL